MSNVPRFFDKCGKEVKPGDLIVYGHALGRCAGLKYGRVTAVKLTKSEYSDPEVKLTVQGVDDDWDQEKPSLTKLGTLKFSKRVLKVSEDQIPKEVLELLK